VTVPFPCPSFPPVIEIHGFSLAADHAHSRAAETVALPLPPDADTVGVPTVTATWHFADEGDRGLVIVDDDPQAATMREERKRAGEVRT